MYFYIHLLIDVWGVSNLELLWIKLMNVMNNLHMSSYGHMFLFFLSKHVGVGLPIHMASTFFVLWETFKVFPKWLYLLAFPPAMVECSCCSRLDIVSHFNFCHCGGYVMYHFVVLICISWTTYDVKHCFEFLKFILWHI